MNAFLEIGMIIFVATGVSIIMKLMRQPLVVGYILSGVIVGPYLLNIIESTEQIELFSHLGIAILLFVVGLNLKPSIVREVGKVSVIAGVGQVVFTSVIGFFLIKFLNFETIPAILGALALTFSSTIIILKLISDKEDLNKIYAKISIGILLVQDIIATLILLSLSVTNSSSVLPGSFAGNVTIFFIKGIIFFGLLYLVSRYVLPHFMGFFAKSQELLFLFATSWGIGLAGLFHLIGFSIEIGALVAGIALASSNFSQEMSSRMKPLRDFFILLFFIMLGSNLILSNISEMILPAIILSLFVLIGNPIIVYLIMNILRYRNKTAFLTGLTVAQISEFSLILMALSFSFGYVSEEFVSLITLVGIITIAGSTYFFLYSDKIYDFIKPVLRFVDFSKSKIREHNDAKDADLVIFGYDRVGYDFVETARKMNKDYFVVDFNPTVVEKLKDDKIPCQFGDADDFDFLEEAGVLRAKAIISTIPSFETNLNLVSFYRNHNKKGLVVIIAHTIKDTEALYEKGASYVIMPHYLGAKHASRMLEGHNFDPLLFQRERKMHRDEIKKRKKHTN